MLGRGNTANGPPQTLDNATGASFPYAWLTLNAGLLPLTDCHSQGRSQDFLKGGAQPSLARQTISPACQMYCAHITGDLKCF